MKRTVKLTESELHKVISESVKNILTEIGDTRRGQYMLGRTLGRAHQRGNWDTMKDVHDRIGPLKQDHNPAHWGYLNQMYGDDANRVKWNYKTFKDQDMKKLASDFADFVDNENYIDYYGNFKVPYEDAIHDFEQQVLGYKCTPDMIDALMPKAQETDYSYNDGDDYDDYDDEWTNSILSTQDEDY